MTDASHVCRHAGSLDGSERLKQQVEEIAALKPDVVCLQEVLSDGVREYYEQHLSEYRASYVLTAEEFRCRAGRMMRRALNFVGPQTTISAFLLGSVQSGLMVLHRRDRLELDEMPYALSFTEQSGDLLNIFRPRGALCVPLRLREDGSSLVVVNTHANAESASCFTDSILGLTGLHKKGGNDLNMPSVPLPSPHRSQQLAECFAHAEKVATGSRVIVRLSHPLP